MIQLANTELSETSLTTLAEKQAAIDQLPDFTQRVQYAKQAWKNGKNNAAFTEVRQKLSAMSSGNLRCGYCEDSYADEIEHIEPKDFYPERTFDWNNYLYACGPCNGPKGNQCAVFRKVDGLKIEHTEFTAAPPQGQSVFINPRKENPQEFLRLDLDDFLFRPVNTETTSYAHQRAEYTITVLRLNERDHLVESRENHFTYFRDLLAAYVNDSNLPEHAQRQTNRITTIKRSNHLSVWREMQRQHDLASPADAQAFAYPQLYALFTAAPEALNW